MLILKFYYTDEIEEMKISKNLQELKDYVEKKFEGIYSLIEYQPIGQSLPFPLMVYGDTEEIGVIGEVEEIY